MPADSHSYDDILFLPHHRSQKHPPMSIANRAAQFSPFAALTGYEDIVAETARHTQSRIILDENSRFLLDAKLASIRERLSEHPSVAITYFVPDPKKEGGAYTTRTGYIRKIDSFAHRLLFQADGKETPFEIPIDLISNLDESHPS